MKKNVSFDGLKEPKTIVNVTNTNGSNLLACEYQGQIKFN